MFNDGDVVVGYYRGFVFVYKGVYVGFGSLVVLKVYSCGIIEFLNFLGIRCGVN